MSNLTNNRIDTIMTPAQIADVKTAIDTINSAIGFSVSLTTEERSSLPKISVANKSFTEDAINTLANNAAIFPVYLDVKLMQNDLKLYQQLDELATMLRQTLERIEDTRILAGSEAYVAALSVYKLVGAAASAGVQGTDTIYEQLRERFTVSTNTPATPPTP
ncbi:MAG: hypothetical protein JNL75_05290 [Chitinophagales bacterium]|nr:hypothetical protein [Chitinophagales bacterium]